MRLLGRGLIAFAVGAMAAAAAVWAQPATKFSEITKSTSTQALIQYLGSGHSPNAVEGPRDLTLLHWAAFHGSLDAVKLLVEKGAKIDVRARGVIDWVPLHYAAARGHHDVVRYLLDSGAQIEARTGDGMSPLSAAAFNSQPEVVKYLVTRKADGGQALAYAISKNNRAAVLLLLDAGVDVNATPVLVATSAHAKDWTEVVSGRWIDRESIRRTGDVAYVEFAWLDSRPSQSQDGSPFEWNCRTREGRVFRDGQPHNWAQFKGIGAAIYSHAICVERNWIRFETEWSHEWIAPLGIRDADLVFFDSNLLRESRPTLPGDLKAYDCRTGLTHHIIVGRITSGGRVDDLSKILC